MNSQEAEKNAGLNLSIYLDEDVDSDLLMGVLRKSGFKVISPRAVGMRRKLSRHKINDEVQLAYAAGNGCVFLTANTAHFLNIYKTWKINKVIHCGILLLHKYNNPAKDMTFDQITKAILNIIGLKLEFTNNLYNLNEFNY